MANVLWHPGMTLAGFLIGSMIGMTGVGGGVVTAPVLILFFGISPAQSIGTALLYSAAVKVGSALVYLYRRQVHFPTLAWMLAGGLPGALSGSYLLANLRGLKSNRSILIVVGGSILGAAILGLQSLRSSRPAEPSLRLLPWLSFPIGLEVGFSSAGAGALGSLVLLQFTTLLPVTVIGTDLLFGMGISLAGGGVLFAAGDWNEQALLSLLAGGLVGSPLGSLWAGRIPARQLRIALLVWAALMGAVLLIQGLTIR